MHLLNHKPTFTKKHAKNMHFLPHLIVRCSPLISLDLMWQMAASSLFVAKTFHKRYVNKHS